MGKVEPRFVGYLELWRATDELSKLWCVEYQLMKEGNHQVVD